MTVTLNLEPDVEAALLAQATASGKSVEQYLLCLVEGVVSSNLDTLTYEQRAKAFEEWSCGHRSTAPLSDYAVSREGIYDGRNVG